MKVVADSHAIVWYLADSLQLSDTAAAILEEAEMTDGIWVAAPGLVDLWYASEKRGPSAIAKQEYERVKAAVRDPESNYHVLSFDLETVADVERIPKVDLPDPFDRMIVATALQHGLPLVSADKRITGLNIANVVW